MTNWLLKSYMRLPLLGKVIVPFAALFLVSAMFKLFKTALVLGAIAFVVYLVLKTKDKSKQ